MPYHGPDEEGCGGTLSSGIEAVAVLPEGSFLKRSIARRFGIESSTSADMGNFLNKSMALLEERGRNPGIC